MPQFPVLYKGCKSESKEFCERFSSCFHLQSIFRHCFPVPSFLGTPEVSLSSTVKGFLKPDQDTGPSTMSQLPFFPPTIYIQMSTLKLVTRDLLESFYFSLHHYSSFLSLSLFLNFLKWLGCCNMRQIVALCLLSAWGEVRRRAVTARHQIDGVWKPRARATGNQVLLHGDPT